MFFGITHKKFLLSLLFISAYIKGIYAAGFHAIFTNSRENMATLYLSIIAIYIQTLPSWKLKQ